MMGIERMQLLSAAEAPTAVGVPAGTVRYWASAPSADGMPLLAARGLDRRGRPLYAKADLEALRDRPRRAARGRAVDKIGRKPNTAANGTRASAPLQGAVDPLP